MAKQEAFEEKSRLKNQFRSLDEDEVEFLDSVLESTRAQEAAVKKDTAEQLEAFRRQREQAEKALLGSTSSEVVPTKSVEEDWAAARKRRREKQNILLSKKRKVSATNPAGKSPNKEGDDTKADQPTSTSSKTTTSKPTDTTTKPVSVTPSEKKPEAKPAPAPLVSLGLGDYASDSE